MRRGLLVNSNGRSRSAPLQLLDPQGDNLGGIDREELREEDEFRFFGHPVCLKMQRDGQMLPGCHLPKQVAAVEPSLEVRWLLLKPGGISVNKAAIGRSSNRNFRHDISGCVESDFETIAEFLLRAAQITLAVRRELRNSQADFLSALENNRDIKELHERVVTFASQFAMPGSNS